MFKSIREFLSKYKYDLGPIFYEGWYYIKDNKGDCNQFAYTYSMIESENNFFKFLLNIITLKHVFWLVQSPTNRKKRIPTPRHVALYIKGKGWVDSTNRQIRDKSHPHRKDWPIPFPWVLLRLIMGVIYSIFGRFSIALYVLVIACIIYFYPTFLLNIWLFLFNLIM